MNIILGSGITGLLAKYLFPTWRIIPFQRSRFFSFNPPLCDNYIMASEEIDDVISELVPEHKPLYNYQRGWSASGFIYKEYDKNLCEDWATHTFGNNYPSQISLYLANKMQFNVYNARVTGICQSLLSKFQQEILEEAKQGPVTAIGDHFIIRNGKKEEFDNAISTIPLAALLQLLGMKSELEFKPIHYLRIQTSELDFEGCNQVFVVDKTFSFYKVTKIAPDDYMFYCNEDIPYPGLYLMPIIKQFDVIDGTMIPDGIPCGNTPKLEWTLDRGIYCVGSYAQHDWCMDVASSIIRMIRYAQRGFKSGTITKALLD